ncbi:MAG: mRNA-degrading endonuclease toxin of MazEF toxin-antitoxin module [Arcobacteraceae bacterium]|jgi:mRNA-degrading endonuclease toxin of MazEF toxin-antitoxin module
MYEYDKWNEVKKTISEHKIQLTFKVREIYWVKLGQNVGFEIDGKGDDFLRPVVVFRKFGKNTFLGIPLTSVKKDDIFHFEFVVNQNKKTNYANLSQIKLIDIKRIKSKLGKMGTDEFNAMKIKMRELYEL